MRGPGQPTKITKEMEKTIAELFWLAFTDEQVAMFTDLSPRTIGRMRVGEYCPTIKKAEIRRESIYRKKIWAGKLGWQGAAWALERKYPTQLSRPEVMLQITNNTLNSTVNQALIIQVDTASKISSRVKDSDGRIEKLLKTRNNGHDHE